MQSRVLLHNVLHKHVDRGVNVKSAVTLRIFNVNFKFVTSDKVPIFLFKTFLH